MKAQTDLAREDRPLRGRPTQYACPRCHRVVTELRKVVMANVVSFIECSVCPRCVLVLRGLASACEIVEDLGCA